MPPVADHLQIYSQIDEPDLINVGDQVDLKFPYNSKYNQTLLVRDDGRIAPPFLDPVMAVGKTPEMLREELRFLYGLKAYDPLLNRNSANDREYLINAGDELDIRFDFQADFNAHVIVLPDGKISLVRIKTVVAEGKSPEDLGKELMDRYRQYVTKPELVVIVRNPTSDLVYVNGRPVRLGLKNIDAVNVVVNRQAPRLIYVAGEVGAPGFFPYHVPMTALRAIVGAGGAKRTGQMNSVIILRKVGSGPPLAMRVNLKPEINGQATTDVPLRPFDIVVVPKTYIAKLQDFLDQYLYNLVPVTKNSAFLFLYTINQGRAIVPSPGTIGGG